ncbi:hypothetical protein CCP3SC1AL1_690014 [Gammaproteobacteria bacterium]
MSIVTACLHGKHQADIFPFIIRLSLSIYNYTNKKILLVLSNS